MYYVTGRIFFAVKILNLLHSFKDNFSVHCTFYKRIMEHFVSTH